MSKDISYPNDPDYRTIERRDADVLRAVREAVPRVTELPDSMFGEGSRDLQFDYVSHGTAFSRNEAKAIAGAARRVGADATIRPTACRLDRQLPSTSREGRASRRREAWKLERRLRKR